MEPVSSVIKVYIPNYLSNLPLPNSIGGWFRLGVKDWAALVPFFATIGGISFATYRLFRPKSPVNPSIKKNEAKVVDCLNIEDLGEKMRSAGVGEVRNSLTVMVRMVNTIKKQATMLDHLS